MIRRNSIVSSVRRRRAHQDPPELTPEEQRGLRNVLRGRRSVGRRRRRQQEQDEEEEEVEVMNNQRGPAVEVLDDEDEPFDDIEDDESEDGNEQAAAPDAPPPDPAFHGSKRRQPTQAMRDIIDAMIHVGIITDDSVNLTAFHDLWTRTQRGIFESPQRNPDYSFIQQRLRLIFPTPGASQNLVQFHSGGRSDPYLEVPLHSVFDLSLMLFFYILYKLSTLAHNRAYTLFAARDAEWATRLNVGTANILFNPINNTTSVLVAEVMQIFSYSADVFQVYHDQATVGSEVQSDRWEETGSGEVFRIMSENGAYNFYLFAEARFVLQIGGRWDNALEELVRTVFPRGGITCVKNETDDLCMLYSIAMGIVYDSMHNFFTREKFIDVNTLSRRIDALRLDVHENAKDIMFKIRHRGPGDACDRIESLALKNFCTNTACEEIERIENEFLRPCFALDIYMMDLTVTRSKRIYPCYISKRKSDHRLSILNISYNCWSHYCLITNMREVLSQTGGKIFYTCSKCHRTYYTKQMEAKHDDCINADESEWHWDSAGVPDSHPEFGRCNKCHLKFCSLERYEFHQKHCFMRNKTGSRIVKLVKDPVLYGGGEIEVTDDKYLLFADFECCISPDGEHKFMSYGLYDVASKEYMSGLEMEYFMGALENIACARKKDIYVFFHNAMNYDVNFILQFVLNNRPSWGISVLMKSATRLQTVRFHFEKMGMKKKIVIGDTVHFLTMSLAKIVNSIRKDDLALNELAFPLFFEQMGKAYCWLSHEDFDKVLRKNLFPYRFFESPGRLCADIDVFSAIFEPKEENLKYFSEGLTVRDLEANYPQFREICEKFRVHNAYEYHQIYLLCDVMQITDVFLKARESLFNTHKIDIAKYIGMPGASWAAFLKMNPEMKLPLYTETRFAEFFSSMTRGGVTSAPLRYAKSDASHSILYLDVNGLYPFVMQTYKYPTGKLEWRTFDLDNECNDYLLENYFPYLEESGKGACLCVDLYISDAVKIQTDQFPFAPEHRVLKDCFFDRDGEMYPFLKRWSAANNGEQMKPFVGLVGTLYNKQNYGVHWQLLKWYIEHGLVVSKIHFAVEFDEGDYLKKYVSLNIQIRNGRHDELGKMVYKLLGNSIYGKTFESPFNRGNYMIVREPEKLRGILEDGNLSSITPLEGGGYIVKMDAEEVLLDKPTYIGACVTEYAKLHMYKLFYDQLGRIFPGIELVYTDTDSFIIRVPHEPGMPPAELFRFIEENAPGLIGGIGGQVKSETGEDVIDEVIALRSKLYAYKTRSGKIGKRAKGTTAAAQESELSWDVYKQALFELHAVPTHNVQFKRQAFHVKTIDLLKQSISVNDGKRFICEDGIHTHAWGFYY